MDGLRRETGAKKAVSTRARAAAACARARQTEVRGVHPSPPASPPSRCRRCRACAHAACVRACWLLTVQSVGTSAPAAPCARRVPPDSPPAQEGRRHYPAPACGVCPLRARADSSHPWRHGRPAEAGGATSLLRRGAERACSIPRVASAAGGREGCARLRDRCASARTGHRGARARRRAQRGRFLRAAPGSLSRAPWARPR